MPTGMVAAVPAFTIIDAGNPTEVDTTIAGGSVWIGAAGLKLATGWELKPEGLCSGDVCIPVPEHAGPVTGGAVELSAFASLVGQPVAVSTDPPAAYLGPPFQRYEHTIHSLEAPDFALPDLNGRLHSLREHRGSKVLLVAWASW